MYAIMLFANRDTLTSSFSVCIPLISFCCLMALTRTFDLYWLDMEKVDRIVLFLILVESRWVSLHLIWCWLAVYCVYKIIFRFIQCISDFSKTFITKQYWILSMAFSTSNEMIMFFLPFVYMVDHIYRFWYVESTLHLWNLH